MTNLLDLLQLISTATVLSVIAAIAVPVSRDVVVKWIAGRMQLGVDSRIESLRSDLRKAEETFKGEIRANEQRFNSAVNVALTSLSGRQSAVTVRRLQAIDRLWAHKAKLDGVKPASQFMNKIKFEAAAKASKEQSGMKELFGFVDKMYLGSFNKQATDDRLQSLEAERPFLSPVVWALYSAYNMALMRAVVEIKLLMVGVGEPELLTSTPTDNLLKAALPDLSAYIDKYSASGYYHLLDILETRLLAATQDMLAGKEADAASLELAQSILQAASRATAAPLDATLDAKIPENLRAASPPAEPPSALP
jgi:hypothetical protein